MKECRQITNYADKEIFEYEDTKVPTFLKWVYVLIPLWGIFWAYHYWNGSSGILDRGHWQELEKAAKTTIPFEKSNKVSSSVEYLNKDEN